MVARGPKKFDAKITLLMITLTLTTGPYLKRLTKIHTAISSRNH